MGGVYRVQIQQEKEKTCLAVQSEQYRFPYLLGQIMLLNW